jgi:hypothetical protein
MGATAHRALYARTEGNMMVGEVHSLGVDPSGKPPIWWIGSDAGGLSQPIGPHGPFVHGQAESLAVVTRATGLIVDPIAQSPLVVHDPSNVGRPVSTPRWLTDPCLTRKDERVGEQSLPAVLRLGRSKWVADLIRSALWWGLGAWIHQEDQFGGPLAGSMKLVHPGFLSTERADDSSLRWVLGAAQSYEDRIVFDRDGYATVGGVSYRMNVLRNPASPVDIEGGSMGVFAMSPGAFGLAGKIESYSSGVFQSGVPSGYLRILTPGATPEQVSELQSNWAVAHESSSRRRTAVLSASTEYVPISMDPVSTQLAQVKTLSLGDVAFAFNEDPAMLNAAMNGSMTYANIRDFFRQHQNLSLGIWVSALQDLLSSLLPGTQSVRVDLDQFTRPEPAERYSAYAVALDAGILDIDEVRANEGLGPRTGSAASPEEERNLSAAEVSQKVYLSVQAGVLSVEEAREMIRDAGAKIDPAAIPVLPEPPAEEPAGEVRSLRAPAWRR